MVVEGNVQIAVAVYHEADDVVGIGHISFVGRAEKFPMVGVQWAFPDDQIAVAIVIGGVLVAVESG